MNSHILDTNHNIQTDHQEIVDKNTANIVLKVIGVGGGGNNAVHNMLIGERFNHVDFIVANTDVQALETNSCQKRISLGKQTRGLGAGSDPAVGEQAAIESKDEIEKELRGADVVVIAAGFGGGTGTGAAPVIAKIAKKQGALTIGIVTTPFTFEARKRAKNAKVGIEKLKDNVDAYIVISNDKLAESFGSMPVSESFKLANISLHNIILAIHDILYRIGTINIDFADVKRILTNVGLAVVGIGQATGKDRAIKAVDKAFEQNLYEHNIKTANKILVNLQFDNKTTLNEIGAAVKRVNELLGAKDDDEKEIIVGQETVTTTDGQEIFKVSVVAGGTDVNSVADEVKLAQGEVFDILKENDNISSQVLDQNNSVSKVEETITPVVLSNQNAQATTQDVVMPEATHSSEVKVISLDEKSENANYNKLAMSTLEIHNIFETDDHKDYSDLRDELPEEDEDDDEDQPW